VPKNPLVCGGGGACNDALDTEILECGNREQRRLEIVADADNDHIKVRNPLCFQGFFFGRV